jgi:chorismate mutase
MAVRGIRGAVSVDANTKEAIVKATQSLLRSMVTANKIEDRQIISVFFTVTTDLNADFPAAAARAMGWTDIPLLDAQEMEVPGAMARVIRVLMHVECDLTRGEIAHVYAGAAQVLRPDLH